MTPAQAGPANFVTDVPVQGPTDEGIREMDCYYAQHFLPARSECVDCGGGSIPMWAQTKGLLGEQVSFGGRGALGFALEAAGDPDVWATLTPDQQKWVTDTLVKLNGLIVQSTGTTCPTWAPTITAASGCFQAWFNSINAGAPIRKLRTDGVFDQDTLSALITTTQIHSKDFPTPFPSAAATAAKKKLSTGAMVGIATAGAAALGGVIYVATRGGKRKVRRRRR